MSRHRRLPFPVASALDAPGPVQLRFVVLAGLVRFLSACHGLTHAETGTNTKGPPGSLPCPENRLVGRRAGTQQRCPAPAQGRGRPSLALRTNLVLTREVEGAWEEGAFGGQRSWNGVAAETGEGQPLECCPMEDQQVREKEKPWAVYKHRSNLPEAEIKASDLAPGWPFHPEAPCWGRKHLAQASRGHTWAGASGQLQQGPGPLTMAPPQGSVCGFWPHGSTQASGSPGSVPKGVIFLLANDQDGTRLPEGPTGPGVPSLLVPHGAGTVGPAVCVADLAQPPTLRRVPKSHQS